jgi:hypothetical protein
MMRAISTAADVRLGPLAAGLLLCGCLGVPWAAAAERIHRYDVAVDTELRSMRVRACFAGPPPSVLVAESLDAPAAFVEGKAVMERRQPIQPNGTEMRLKDIAEDGCIEYSVNLAGGYTKNDLSGNTTKRVGRDLFTEVGLWFWRPAQLAADEDIEVAFSMPEGLSVSTPWRPAEGVGPKPTYRTGRAEFDRPSAASRRFPSRCRAPCCVSQSSTARRQPTSRPCAPGSGTRR